MKKNKLKNLLHAKFMAATLIAFMLITASEAKVNSHKSNTFDSTWKLDASLNDVDCYYKIENCNGINVVFLAFNNKNSVDMKITWIDYIKTQLENEMPSFVGQKELVLAPGESNIYDCNSKGNASIIKPGEDVSPSYLIKISGYKIKVTSSIPN